MDKHTRNKDFDYFSYFCDCAKLATEAADALHDTFLHFDASSLRTRIDEIHKIEHAADAKRHEMSQHLGHAFLTPIEREDIVALAQQLDNVVDNIEEVARRAYMFNLTAVRPEALRFTELIIKCCHGLENTLAGFNRFKKANDIAQYCIQVNALESDGDVLHLESIRRLFSMPTDDKTRTIWLTMFECMESCLDACEDTVDIIEGIIMKNT